MWEVQFQSLVLGENEWMKYAAQSRFEKIRIPGFPLGGSQGLCFTYGQKAKRQAGDLFYTGSLELAGKRDQYLNQAA